MIAPAALLVDASTLPVYPIPSAEKLKSHWFLTFRYRDWLKSVFRNLADREVRAVGFDLFCIAQDENPVGTLPVNEQDSSPSSWASRWTSGASFARARSRRSTTGNAAYRTRARCASFIPSSSTW